MRPAGAPAPALASLPADDAAEAIEKKDYPGDQPGTPLGLAESLLGSLRFFLIVAAANIVALLLLLVPGVNLIVFFLVNGYLLGREYFEFAAMRFRPVDEAKAMRKANAPYIFLAGMVIAAFVSIPLVNLATPIFAMAYMVHVHKRLSGRRPELIEPPR